MENMMASMETFPANTGNEISDYELKQASTPDQDDVEDRLARSRERNREHARRTRLRKKAQLQALQARMQDLQNESKELRQNIEQCNIASILLGLTSSGGNNAEDKSEKDEAITTRERALSDLSDYSSVILSSKPIAIPTSVKGRRKRFISDLSTDEQLPTQFSFEIRGQTTVIGGGGKNHINWKTGVYCDENGEQQQLTSEELETLRRERNRMHAKMTRDRKKNFISSVQRTISQLEEENGKLREILRLQVQAYDPSSSSEKLMPKQAALKSEEETDDNDKPKSFPNCAVLVED